MNCVYGKLKLWLIEHIHKQNTCCGQLWCFRPTKMQMLLLLLFHWLIAINILSCQHCKKNMFDSNHFSWMRTKKNIFLNKKSKINYQKSIILLAPKRCFYPFGVKCIANGFCYRHTKWTEWNRICWKNFFK